MFAPKETRTLLKLHVKLDTLTKALYNLNLKAKVFVVDLDEHKTQVEEIESEILEILDLINLIYKLN